MNNTIPKPITDEEYSFYFADGDSVIAASENVGDPVCHNGCNKWFFFSETWIELYGPFETEQECRASLVEYAKTL